MTAPTWPPQPINRIRHGWRCTSTGPVVETIRADTAGRPHVVLMSVECDGHDLDARIRDEGGRKPT